jgi:hypothetical protein
MSAGHLFAGGIDRSAADSGTSRPAYLRHRVGRWRCCWGRADKRTAKSARPSLDSAPPAETTTIPSRPTGGHVHITVDDAGVGTSSTPTAKVRYWMNPRPAARGQRFGKRWIDDQRGCRFIVDGDNGDSMVTGREFLWRRRSYCWE